MTTLRVNGRALRVLIVEDEPVIGWDMQLTLTQAGAEIVAIEKCAHNAIELLSAARPDIALIDIRLKGVDQGFRVAEACRSRGLPAVFVTGMADRTTTQRAQQLGIPLILKPTFGGDLIAAIRRAAGLEGRTVACAARVWQISALPRRIRLAHGAAPPHHGAAAIIRAADRVIAEHKDLIAIHLDLTRRASRLIAQVEQTRMSFNFNFDACRDRLAPVAR